MTIRLLVTGFTPFPGAPENPTEHLIRAFEAEPPLAGRPVECCFAVLPVDYGRAIPALEEAGNGFRPDIAIHFGLARQTEGFRLERLARNAIASPQPDNAGTRPDPSPILPGADHVESTLPLTRIAQALEGQGHVVSWSDDAGGYLCNYVFYHSAAGLCRTVDARMSGFIHVGEVLPENFRFFRQGAELILETCVEELANG
jgi:pyroglutamyl-peptidase